MRLSDMVPVDQVIEHSRETNPEFRTLWDASELARAVATEVVRYRAERGLTQAQLGELVGLTQPQVARLESGEETPTLRTLAKVSAATDLEFLVNVSHGTATLAAA
jgi:DNA-binding XRE family transcriptional regulator